MWKHILGRIILIFVALMLIITLLFFSMNIAMFHKYFKSLTFVQYFPFIWDDFVEYLTNIFKHWDWGISRDGDPVWDIVFYKVHYTLKITLASVIFFLVFGLILGIFTALKKDTVIDKTITTLLALFSVVPNYVIVWFLMLSIGWGLQWVPPYYPVSTEAPIQALLGFVIPVLALSLWPLAKITFLVRGEVSEILSEEFMLLARTKGLTKFQCVKRHAMKNAFVVVLPELVTSFLFVLGSSFIVEIIYNIQGVANLFFDSLLSPFMDGYYVFMDIPVAILIATFYMSFGLVFSLIVDIIQSFVDPRIRMGSKKAQIE
ncbi:MAG: ABC transporter permease [Tenericutes bacterium]|nr:ABC transporter permease [Mycoplasmatota bacterium]